MKKGDYIKSFGYYKQQMPTVIELKCVSTRQIGSVTFYVDHQYVGYDRQRIQLDNEAHSHVHTSAALQLQQRRKIKLFTNCHIKCLFDKID